MGALHVRSHRGHPVNPPGEAAQESCAPTRERRLSDSPAGCMIVCVLGRPTEAARAPGRVAGTWVPWQLEAWRETPFSDGNGIPHTG